MKKISYLMLAALLSSNVASAKGMFYFVTGMGFSRSQSNLKPLIVLPMSQAQAVTQFTGVTTATASVLGTMTANQATNLVFPALLSNTPSSTSSTGQLGGVMRFGFGYTCEKASKTDGLYWRGGLEYTVDVDLSNKNSVTYLNRTLGGGSYAPAADFNSLSVQSATLGIDTLNLNVRNRMNMTLGLTAGFRFNQVTMGVLLGWNPTMNHLSMENLLVTPSYQGGLPVSLSGEPAVYKKRLWDNGLRFAVRVGYQLSPSVEVNLELYRRLGSKKKFTFKEDQPVLSSLWAAATSLDVADSGGLRKVLGGLTKTQSFVPAGYLKQNSCGMLVNFVIRLGGK